MNKYETEQFIKYKPGEDYFGQMIYGIVLPGRKVYIGQTDRGFKRIQEHFSNSYYNNYVPGTKRLYDELRKVAGNKVEVYYAKGPLFGLQDKDKVLNNFRKRYRFKSDLPLKTDKLKPGCILNYAEVIHTYAALKNGYDVLGTQMGGQTSDALCVVSMANIGKEGYTGIDVLTRESTPEQAEMVFDAGNLSLYKTINGNIQQAVKVKEILRDVVDKSEDDIAQAIYNIILQGLANNPSGVSQAQQSIEEKLAEKLKAQVDEKLKTRQEWLEGLLERKINLDLKKNMKAKDDGAQKIFSHTNFISKIKGKHFEDKKGYTLQQIKSRISKYIKDAVAALDKMDVVEINLFNVLDEDVAKQILEIEKRIDAGQRNLPLMSSHLMDKDFIKYYAVLRFHYVGWKKRDQYQPIWSTTETRYSVPGSGVLSTRPTRMKKNSDGTGEHEVPQYNFQYETNEGDLKKALLDYYQSYYPRGYGKDGDYFYRVMMGLVQGKDEVLEPVSRTFTFRNEKERYKFYIHGRRSWGTTQPTGEPAYILKLGTYDWVADMMDVDMSQLVDY